MTDLPADWAIAKALKEAGDILITVEEVRKSVAHSCYISAIVKLARYIEAHEKPPVGRKTLCVREAVARMYPNSRDDIERGEWDGDGIAIGVLSGITLWEGGFGEGPETTVQKCQ